MSKWKALERKELLLNVLWTSPVLPTWRSGSVLIHPAQPYLPIQCHALWKCWLVFQPWTDQTENQYNVHSTPNSNAREKNLVEQDPAEKPGTWDFSLVKLSSFGLIWHVVDASMHAHFCLGHSNSIFSEFPSHLLSLSLCLITVLYPTISILEAVFCNSTCYVLMMKLNF